MHEEMNWDYGMRRCTAGAASARCFEDLVSQRGRAEAERLRDVAVGKRLQARRLWPNSPGRDMTVIVECMLLAIGVAEDEVGRLARRYRSGEGASEDLSRWG